MRVTARVRMPMFVFMIMVMVMLMPGMVALFHWPQSYVSCATLRQLLERPHTPQRWKQYAGP